MSLSQNSGLQATETQVKPISAEIGTQGGRTVELHKLGVPGMELVSAMIGYRDSVIFSLCVSLGPFLDLLFLGYWACTYCRR